jgi:alpha-D-ribose 1-methylphosphonate 5-triphosphate synthase subunit PhnH
MRGLSPGFAAPVRDSQAAFRALLDAMARPGTIVVPRAPPAPPSPLPPAMAAVALVLVDRDTPLWIDAGQDGGEAVEWIRFHCGCRLVPQPEEAAFVFVTCPQRMPAHARLRAGTDEYPDTSATLVVSVDALGSGEVLRLTGPGIDGATTLRVGGLPDRFVAERAENHRLFPRGVDAILVAGERLAALPRSTAVVRQGS